MTLIASGRDLTLISAAGWLEMVKSLYLIDTKIAQACDLHIPDAK